MEVFMPQSQKEIFNSQLHFKTFERCFNTENEYDGRVFHEWSMFRDNNITDMYAAFEMLGMDTFLNSWGYIFGAPVEDMPRLGFEVIGETEETVITRKGDGSIEEKYKNGRWGGRIMRLDAMTPEIWEKIKAEHYIIDDPRRNIDIERIKKDLAGRENHMPLGMWVGSIIGLTRIMLTLEGAVYACCDYPEMIDDMAETNCRLAERFLDQLLPHFAFDAAFIYENITCKNGPTIPVWVIRDIVAPRWRRLCEKLKAHGVGIISVGSDGDVRPILPIMLDCGINCLSPYEVNGCVHPSVLLDEYRGVLRIIGGVDKLIFHNGRNAIDEFLTSLVPYVKRGGFIPHIDYNVYSEIGQENFLYYLEKKRQLFS